MQHSEDFDVVDEVHRKPGLAERVVQRKWTVGEMSLTINSGQHRNPDDFAGHFSQRHARIMREQADPYPQFFVYLQAPHLRPRAGIDGQGRLCISTARAYHFRFGNVEPDITYVVFYRQSRNGTARAQWVIFSVGRVRDIGCEIVSPLECGAY